MAHACDVSLAILLISARATGDDASLDRARTQNDLAASQLKAGRVAEALSPLRVAIEAVEKQKLVALQEGVATNLRLALEAIDKQEKLEEGAVKWLWSIGEMSAASDVPEIVPSSRILRAALAAEIRRGTPAAKLAAAERLRKIALPDQPPEVRADLVIRAARLALDAGDSRKALAWVEKLDCGGGPAAPHLRAQALVLRAIAEAAGGSKDAFVKDAPAAVEAFRALGDYAGLKDGVARVVDAATRLNVESQLAKLVEERDRLAQAGGPGGLGGMAKSGGKENAFEALEAHAPVFGVSAQGGKIRILDLLTNDQQEVEAVWQPRSVALNGITLTVFGGWISVQMLAYGLVSLGTGMGATMTLDELGEYWPVPGKGRLLLLKNGAVRYEGK